MTTDGKKFAAMRKRHDFWVRKEKWIAPCVILAALAAVPVVTRFQDELPSLVLAAPVLFMIVALEASRRLRLWLIEASSEIARDELARVSGSRWRTAAGAEGVVVDIEDGQFRLAFENGVTGTYPVDTLTRVA